MIFVLLFQDGPLPPHIPSTIPFLGQAISFGASPIEFLLAAYQKVCSLPCHTHRHTHTHTHTCTRTSLYKITNNPPNLHHRCFFFFFSTGQFSASQWWGKRSRISSDQTLQQRSSTARTRISMQRKSTASSSHQCLEKESHTTSRTT